MLVQSPPVDIDFRMKFPFVASCVHCFVTDVPFWNPLSAGAIEIKPGCCAVVPNAYFRDEPFSLLPCFSLIIFGSTESFGC